MVKSHLAPLTTLRFAAALFIFVHHVMGKFGLPNNQVTGLFFGIGVPFFFALSGFILGYNYQPSRSPVRIVQMIGYRIARIWPLHLACFALFLISSRMPANPLQGADQAVPNLFLVHAWLGSFHYSFSFNAVSWSLSAEMFFYVAFPFLILCGNLALLTIAVGAAVLTITIAGYLPPNLAMARPEASAAAFIATHPLSSLPIFISGILASRAFGPLFRVQISVVLATVVEVAMIALFVAFMFEFRSVSAAMSQLVDAGPLLRRWMPMAAGILVFVPVILTFAAGKGLVSRILSLRPGVWLGEISFAFYLCHQMTLGWLNRGFSLGPAAGVLIGLGLSLGLSALLHYRVEKPAQRRLRAMIDRATDSKPVASSSPSATGYAKKRGGRRVRA